MHINLIVLGKLKEKNLKNIEKKYTERISPFSKIKVFEIEAESFDSKDDKEKLKEKELEKIKKILKLDDFIIFLDESGEQKTSDEFAHFLEKNTQNGKHLTFVIGDSLGLHKDHKRLSNFELSLSKMTFTHEMARILLLEQIYRAITIQKGKTYHY